MSRIGKKHITIPTSVKVEQNDRLIVVKGPKGTLDYGLKEGIIVEIVGNEVIVKRENDKSRHQPFYW